MEGVLALATFLLTTRMAQVFSTQYLLGILKHFLEVMLRNPWTDPLFPGPGDPELKVLTSF